jgi:hypothetical protein
LVDVPIFLLSSVTASENKAVVASYSTVKRAFISQFLPASEAMVLVVP